MVILIKTKKKERKKIYTQLGRSFSFFSHSFCLSNKKVPPHLFLLFFLLVLSNGLLQSLLVSCRSSDSRDREGDGERKGS